MILKTNFMQLFVKSCELTTNLWTAFVKEYTAKRLHPNAECWSCNLTLHELNGAEEMLYEFNG